MKRSIIQLIILLILPATLFGLEEYTPREYTPTRTLSVAGANRAAASKTDAAYINPAAMISIGQKYMIDLSFQYGGDHTPNNLSAAAVDTKTSAVGGGLFINYYDKDIAVDGQEDDDTYKGFATGISYAYPLGALVAGMNVKYLKYEKNDDNTLHTVTFDLALMYQFSEYVKAAVIGYNLTALENEQAPLSAALGVMLGDEKSIVLTFDMVADFDAPDLQDKDATALFKYSFGGRLTPFDGFTLMGGYQIDQVIDQNFWAMGVEYTIPTSRLEANFGYLQSTSDDSNRIFSFSFKIYL